MQSQNQELIDLLHSEFPAVNKLTIQNEVRKNKGDLKDARKTVQSISDSIAEADAILGEEQKEYQDSSSSDEGESYESQDENDEEEISKICTPKVDNYLEESKEKVEQQSEEIYADLAKDLIEKFPGVPPTCVEECVKFFYPNLGKIEQVLGEFQKQWVMYSQDFDGYKRGKGKRRERAKKEGKRKDRSKTKRGKKSTKDIDHDVNPELAAEIDKIQELLDNDMNDLSKDEIKTLKGNLKVMKKEIRGLRKEHKKKLKDERKAIKSEAKKLKKEEREKIKHEKRLKREEETKKRSMKDYEDDVFFREVREEPSIIKQYLKETKKDLKRARKEGEEEKIAFLENKLAEYEASLETETDKAIMLTYKRYNKPEEATSRLDLHGLKKAEAMRLLEKILNLRLKQIEEKNGPKDEREPIEFNIVTGRGSHTGRPILKMAAKDFLLDRAIEFREFSNNAGYTLVQNFPSFYCSLINSIYNTFCLNRYRGNKILKPNNLIIIINN